MLKEAIKLNPNGVAIFVAGDMADDGEKSQYEEMMSLHNEVMVSEGKNPSDYPLYLAIGNHDYPSAYTNFLEFAVLPDGSNPTDSCYDFWLNGYYYIFLGSDSPSGLTASFTEETLAWLDSKLSEDRYSARPTFVFLHQPIYNTVSGSLPGEGWDGVYNYQALVDVLKNYPEVLLFTGHTHWTMDSVGNIFEGTEDFPIHAFNCASVSYLWSGFNSKGGEHLDGSQGYYVEIYDGKVYVRGVDFITSEWISNAQYLIELEKPQNVEIADIFEFYGISTRENGSGLTVGYSFNKELYDLYLEQNPNVTLDFGSLFAVKGYEALTTSFVGFTENAGRYDVTVTGLNENHADLVLEMTLYVTVNGETSYIAYNEGETVFVNNRDSLNNYKVSDYLGKEEE